MRFAPAGLRPLFSVSAARRALVLMSVLALAPLGAQGRGGGVSVAGMGHDKGRPGAPVYMIEFGDFGCGYCAKFARETWPLIDSLYVRTGRLRFKYVPFVTGMFRHSREVSIAAECAARQDAFWKMHDLLYERRREWMASRGIATLIATYARELRLDGSAFTRCTMDPGVAARIARNDQVANALYIRGTPTFFVNGRVIPGAAPFEIFKQIIEGSR